MTRDEQSTVAQGYHQIGKTYRLALYSIAYEGKQASKEELIRWWNWSNTYLNAAGKIDHANGQRAAEGFDKLGLVKLSRGLVLATEEDLDEHERLRELKEARGYFGDGVGYGDWLLEAAWLWSYKGNPEKSASLLETALDIYVQKPLSYSISNVFLERSYLRMRKDAAQIKFREALAAALLQPYPLQLHRIKSLAPTIRIPVRSTRLHQNAIWASMLKGVESMFRDIKQLPTSICDAAFGSGLAKVCAEMEGRQSSTDSVRL